MDGGIGDLYLNFNVLNNEVFEIENDDILMSDWGDEGWKARKKNDGNWEFTPIG